MSYPSHIPPDLYGNPYHDQDAGLIDPMYGASIGQLAANGLAPPFGWLRGDSGTAVPNFEMYDLPQRAMLPPAVSQNQLSGYGYDSRAESVFPSVTRSDMYCREGDACFNQQKYEEAIAAYDHAILYYQRNCGAITNKATALNALGQWAEALAVSNQAILLSSHGYVAYNNKAFALTGLGNFDDALAVYVYEAIPADNYTAITRNNIGDLLIRMGRYNEALSAIEQGIYRDNTNFIAYNNMGVALMELGRFKEAWAALNQAIALNPNFSSAYVNKADVLIRIGRYAEALSVLNDAIQRDPYNRIAPRHKTRAMIGQGRDMRSLAEYEQTMRNSGEFVSSVAVLAIS